MSTVFLCRFHPQNRSFFSFLHSEYKSGKTEKGYRLTFLGCELCQSENRNMDLDRESYLKNTKIIEIFRHRQNLLSQDVEREEKKLHNIEV